MLYGSHTPGPRLAGFVDRFGALLDAQPVATWMP